MNKTSLLTLEYLNSKDNWSNQLSNAIPFLSDKTCRLFAVSCARDSFKNVKDIDARSIQAVDVAERYAFGLATQDELSAAESAAWSAASSARSAAESAAWSAAWSSARSAAESAAWSAAWSAASSARSAAESAAWSAESAASSARSAAESAAWSAASSARSAAWSAASAAEERQKVALIRLIEEELYEI